jgi:hypothetical protein
LQFDHAARAPAAECNPDECSVKGDPMFTRILFRWCLPVFSVSLLALSSAHAQCLDWQSGFGPAGASDGIRALAVFDDGSGLAVYAGGYFTAIGGVAASHVAKWDGNIWSPLGAGTNDSVLSLSVVDVGSGAHALRRWGVHGRWRRRREPHRALERQRVVDRRHGNGRRGLRDRCIRRRNG